MKFLNQPPRSRGCANTRASMASRFRIRVAMRWGMRMNLGIGVLALNGLPEDALK